MTQARIDDHGGAEEFARIRQPSTHLIQGGQRLHGGRSAPAVMAPGTGPAARHQAPQLLALQRAAGNRAVAGVVSGRARAAEAVAGGSEPDQERSDEPARLASGEVTAVFRGGSEAPEVRSGGHTPKADAILAEQRVDPTGTPTAHAGGGNDCVPGTESLDWEVVDDGRTWRANVTALNVSADIHVTDWPSNPSTMTVPNTPNPVVGGNINDTAGSANHWRAAINDMADYDTTTGGGAGPDWHSTAASRAHEWAHWNRDYLGDTIPTAGWRDANQAIDRITVPKGAHADAAAARVALEPRVTARFNRFVAAATRRWNQIIRTNDHPGKGGRGYRAGNAVLRGVIRAVRAFASAQGWTRARSRRTP